MIRETDRHQKTPLYAFGDSNVGTFFEDILNHFLEILDMKIFRY